MKQKLKVTQRVLLLCIALFTGWLVFGSTQTVTASHWQAQSQISLDLTAITLHSTEAKVDHTLTSYGCPKQDLTTASFADSLEYRWEAMGKYYAAHKDLTTFNAEEILAYRWQAMAEFYAANLDLTTFNAEEILAYRWQAMAEFYTTHEVCLV
ncbi:MAG: hypothetical protein JW757_01890 [Anaerolineales bacterium]|nr:hypothetical protein [Anaerolineales bacterium]